MIQSQYSVAIGPLSTTYSIDQDFRVYCIDFTSDVIIRPLLLVLCLGLFRSSLRQWMKVLPERLKRVAVGSCINFWNDFIYLEKIAIQTKRNWLN